VIEGRAPSGRVVITGIGVVSPIGTGLELFWSNILAGTNGIERMTLVDPDLYSTKIAAEVKDFKAEDWVEKREARRLDRFISFAVAAATMALKDSEVTLTEELRDEFGVLIGSGIGGIGFMAEQCRILVDRGPSRVSPFWVPYMIADMASGYTSIVHDLRGPNTCVVTACSTGANALGDAYHIIKRGDATAMLAGGSEAPVNEIGVSAFCAARAMSQNNDDPHHASRPFDKGRDGFVMAEGASVMVLEDRDFAIERGAKIYGEIVGYGMSGDAHHITMPHPEGRGATRSMQMAIRNAGIKPEDVGYINAHGTSTYYNDKFETQAIKNVFGDHAYKVPVSSTKSMTGHMLGAAGALEATVCVMAMRDGKVPPTINYETPDPECDLDYVPNVAREHPAKYSLSNSFGFGGHNVSLIFKSNGA
jgi:3-oxoacyl-[acyl-carrier-protein] synthase II